METWRLALEAAGSLLLPCSATLVVPGVLVAILGRGRLDSTVALVVGLVGGSIAAVLWGLAPPDVVTGLALAAGGLAVARWGTATSPRPRALAAGGALVGGLAAGALWKPCVGEHLGTALTTGVRDPWSGVVPLAVYLLVLSVPVMVVGMLAATTRGQRWLGRPAVVATTVVVVALGAAVVIGLGDDVTGALFRWST